MSTYNYAPPPPPPPTSGGASFGQSSSAPYGQSRGGGSGSRRGGHYHGGRGDYHNSQPRYEYTGQPYPAQHAVPYGSSHPPANSYPAAQPQWTPDHGHAPAHHAHPHAPVPLSATNYHPNYAPQPYAPSQYPQQAPYAAPQPYPYQAPPPPPSQAQWSGQAAHQTYGNSRGRGGGYGDRGGHKPSQGVPPVRHSHEYDAAPPPIVGSFPQSYPPDHRVVHYPPPQYAYAAPPPPPVAARHPESSHGQYPRRGRGGHRDGHGKGRGSHHSHHHGANDKPRLPKPSNNNLDNASKPDKSESPSVGKKKKRKTNTLGLTPGVDSETEDDEGEEKTLTELIGQETLNISDVAAFIAERKKKFPTRARIEAKKAAELARKEEDKAASLEKEADRLRKQLRRVEFSIKRKREQGDEGDEMREPSDDSSDDEPEVMSSRTQTAPPPSSSAKKADITRHCKYYSTGGTCGKKGKCRFVHDPQAREAAIKEREANNGRLTIQQRLILNDKEQEDLAILQSIQYLREKGLMNTAGASAAAPLSNEEKKLAAKSASTSTPVPTSTLTSTSAPASVSTLPPSTSSLPAIPPQPAKREPPRRSNPPPSIIPTANSISAQGVKHYQGWLLKPYGSSSGKQSRSDDLP
ncbi:hypothetical protein TRIATDRAFT_290973 [Trichoderma atroviride IMI 206040]|uniref:C3H1-type domain-containing protein n=1 Tax=Hypocrea atroviridis (strain ATCC 20476 / IMI 206040) TaxID=452589 RepID=G9NNF6_HYPAI|nr:uncharacterized protein TRIATDRAFT_290973 [Trichoderma atroviride IMI 206040]EHK47602.1 hypothetical protein TRIATDRAFT_290973 [Trichoderma atroviride IMI 206040]